MKFFEHITGFFSSKRDVVKNLYELFKLEAELAKLTFYSFLINVGLLIAVIFSSWIAAMVLIGYLILLFSGNFLASIGGVLLFNLILLMLTLKRIMSNLKNMSFEKTRACLTKNNVRETDEFQKKITEEHCRSGPKCSSGSNTSS